MFKSLPFTSLLLLFTVIASTGCAERQIQPNISATTSLHTELTNPELPANKKEPLAELVTAKQVSPTAVTSNDLWPRIRAGMQLTEHSHPRLDKQLAWYSSNQSYIDRVFKRGERYLYHIVNELEAQQMPLELALLPVVESAFDPFAYSHSHAAGLWQFIPSTGKRFGLERNWWYDGRRDPVASTAAAIKYLSYLNRYFDGDWLLALAAYNSGEGNVRRAIARNKRLGKPTDFWSLKLPKETQAYVPQLLAVAAVIRTPEKYNTVLPKIANRPYFDSIELDEQADLASIAKMAGIETEEIYKLNAGFNRWVTQPGGSQQRLLLPIESIATFKKAFESTPKSQWVAIKQYRVKSGDNLSSIAQRHNVSVRQLKQTNRLKSNFLSIDQRLQIPGTGLARPLSGPMVSYNVKPGDSLWKIARKHSVSIRNIAKWNNLDVSAPLKLGQVLELQAPRQQVVNTTKKLRYRVRSGDSLSRIASKFGLKIRQIVRWNSLNPSSYLQPGQRLTLFVDIRNI